MSEYEHWGIRSDNANAAKIPPKKRCERCDGTGNELYSMYRQCQACGGNGISKGNEDQFDE
jgi:DnaJ-class molecular chaperone